MRVLVARRIADRDRMRSRRGVVVPMDMRDAVAVPVQMGVAEQRRRGCLLVVMGVRVPVIMMIVPGRAARLAPCGDGDPQAEPDQREARDSIDKPAEPLCERGAGEPDDPRR